MAEELFEKLDIVTVTYNTPIEFIMCLSSVHLFTKNCKVIVIDNGDEEMPLEESLKKGV